MHPRLRPMVIAQKVIKTDGFKKNSAIFQQVATMAAKSTLESVAVDVSVPPEMNEASYQLESEARVVSVIEERIMTFIEPTKRKDAPTVIEPSPKRHASPGLESTTVAIITEATTLATGVESDAVNSMMIDEIAQHSSKTTTDADVILSQILERHVVGTHPMEEDEESLPEINVDESESEAE